MTDWSRGYTAGYRLFLVNPLTWEDEGLVSRASGATMESDLSKPLLQSGSVSFDLDAGETFGEGYYRLALTATQDGGSQRHDVWTMLFTSTTRNVQRGHVMVPAVGRSVLWPASRTAMEVGSYAPSGVDGAQYVQQILGGVLRAPVMNYGSFGLSENVVFDVGTKVLDAAWKVLAAGGHTLEVDGRGIVYIVPQRTQPTIVLDKASGLAFTSSTITRDASNVPNRYKAISGSDSATATNDDIGSPTSVTNKGYFDDVVDKAPKRVNGETLQAYAERRLAEESTIRIPMTYNREWNPSVGVGHIVRLDLPEIELVGDCRVKRQAITCSSTGITVAENAEMEERTWR